MKEQAMKRKSRVDMYLPRPIAVHPQRERARGYEKEKRDGCTIIFPAAWRATDDERGGLNR